MITVEQAETMVIDFSIRAVHAAARRLIDQSYEATNLDVKLTADSGLIDWDIDTDSRGYIPLPTEQFNILQERIDKADQSTTHNGYENADTFRVAIHFHNEPNAYTYLRWLRSTRRRKAEKKVEMLTNWFRGVVKYTPENWENLNFDAVNFKQVYESLED